MLHVLEAARVTGLADARSGRADRRRKSFMLMEVCVQTVFYNLMICKTMPDSSEYLEMTPFMYENTGLLYLI
jgi:hypothetical protein